MFDDAESELSALLDTPTNVYKPTTPRRQSHPKGFEPGVSFDTGKWTVTTPPMEHLAAEADWQKALDALGVEIPPGWVIRLVEMRYDPAAWHRDNVGEDAVTRPVWRYRFAVEQAPEHGASNLNELVKEIRDARLGQQIHGGWGSEGTFVVSWNDWQLFKSIGDGIDGTIDRIFTSFDVVVSRIEELRKIGREYPRLLVVATGDIVEGCAIYPHQSYEISGDMRDQRNAGRRLIVEGLKHFAPHFTDIQVLAVGGNHGENRIDGKKINRHDNSDAEVFEQAADVLAENPAYGHITFHVPREELAATIEVEGWVLGATHGHIAGKGAGGPEAKLYGWFKGQAAGKRPVGDSDVLVTSHFHHKRLADWGGCLWLQAPTMDGGSPQHTDLTGMSAEAGLLTFGMTEAERCRDVEFTPL